MGEDDGNGPRPGAKWIRYVSPDRRVLWTELQGFGAQNGNGTDPVAAGFPDPGVWNDLLDAAFSTHLPQCGFKTLNVNGRDGYYTLKAFPDFSLNGQFKGVIQVIELRTSGERDGDAMINRDREVHAVLDLTLCGVVLYDPPEDRILNVNRRAAQQTGYALRELEGMSGRVLFGDIGVALLKGIHARMSQAGTGMVWGQMLGICGRDGVSESFFCSLRLIPDQPREDAPPAMMISMDAAEIDAVSGMARAGPNPRFVMEALQDGLWEYDTVTNTLHYGESFGRIFGPEGVPGGPGKAQEELIEALYPGESDVVFHNYRMLLKKGTPYRTPYRVRDAGGDWHWILATIHAILNDGSGRPTKVLGFHMDITDAMKSSTEVMEMEERLRAIFDNAGIGIAVSDVNGTLARVNPALALMLGRNREDIEGRWLTENVHPDDRNELRSVLFRILRGGRRESVSDIRFQRPDGREVWANIVATMSRKVSDGARYVIVMVEDVTASRANRERVQYEATHDALTGAWNRGVLLERLGQHIHLALRHGQPMTFCMCDLDHFKVVNDLHGHQAGDQVLVRFVNCLREAVRETDVIGRYGGEEFGIVFPSTTVDGAAAAMGRALELIRSEKFVDSDGVPFRASATFGVSGVVPGCTVKNVVAWADAALYAGKESGRSRVVVGKPDLGEWM